MRWGAGAKWVAAVLGLSSFACGAAANDGCSSDVECKGDRICVARSCVQPDVVVADAGSTVDDQETCGASGYCMTTSTLYGGNLGGLAGADRRCQAEFPGSHFYRRSCDASRNFRSLFGYAELELGTCWNCNDWTGSDSGSYEPNGVDCSTGYATVGALVPPALADGDTNPEWRICEAIDKPLMCCIP